MNIFVLDLNPATCARYHHDVHLRKMIVETAQLLSTAHHEANSTQAPFVYKRTHVNHPCAIWARRSDGNYWWLFKLFSALCDEYAIRTGKSHKTENLRECFSETPRFPLFDFSTPPQCMPDEYKVPNDVVQAYRNYYKAKKLVDKNGIPMASWTKRDIPYWLGS